VARRHDAGCRVIMPATKERGEFLKMSDTAASKSARTPIYRARCVTRSTTSPNTRKISQCILRGAACGPLDSCLDLKPRGCRSRGT